MSISGIEGFGFTPLVTPTADAGRVVGAGSTSSVSSREDFGNLVLDGIDRLEKIQDKADGLAIKAATGDLNSIHDYTIAATEAGVATQLTVAVRNKAIEAFTEIMRMQV